MTGRKARVVRDARGRGVYALRARPDSSEMDSLNIKEKQQFMEVRLAGWGWRWGWLCGCEGRGVLHSSVPGRPPGFWMLLPRRASLLFEPALPPCRAVPCFASAGQEAGGHRV